MRATSSSVTEGYHERTRSSRSLGAAAVKLEQRELDIGVRDRRLGLRDGFQLRPVDAHDDARTAALELDRRVAGTVDLAERVETRQHPADRRRLVRAPLGIDRARD